MLRAAMIGSIITGVLTLAFGLNRLYGGVQVPIVEELFLGLGGTIAWFAIVGDSGTDDQLMMWAIAFSFVGNSLVGGLLSAGIWSLRQNNPGNA